MLFQQDFSVHQTLYRKNFLIILGKLVCMRWKEFVKDYLHFSKKDRIAGIFIALLIITIYLLPRFFHSKTLSSIKSEYALKTAMDTLSQRSVDAGSDETGKSYIHEVPDKRDIKLFDFDPNTASVADWTKLGLKEKTAQMIINYLTKGGHFYKREDLGKIWGLPRGFLESVKDHIVIQPPAGMNKAGTAFTSYPAYKKTYPQYENKNAVTSVNINADDTSAFIKLPGIGNKLATRITGFREKLGGFYSVDQVGETYGLPDSTFQKIKSFLKTDGTVKKININTSTKDQLKEHPYIRWKLANAIVEYRNQHGNFQSIDDLKKIVVIDDKTFEKIKHYVEL
jgi:competence protein ComEA